MADTQHNLSPATPIPAHVPPERVFDFDLFHDPRIAGDVQLGHMSLHEDAPDIFYTPRNGGHWVVTRMADLVTVMTKLDQFSAVNAFIRPTEPGKNIPLPPQDMDAPDHMRHRLLLLKFLAPKEVKTLEPLVRELINGLIDKLEGRHACEFKSEVAMIMPVELFMSQVKWDTTRLHEFVEYVHDITGSDDAEKQVPAFMEVNKYLTQIIQERLETPGDDWISQLLSAKINGETISVKRVQEMANLLFLAGLDTVTNAMTYITHHLAQNPKMQQYLRAHPERIPVAVEEFMRRYAFANVVRRVIHDTELNGVKVKAGERIICSLAAASNDETCYANPKTVDLDRNDCPHVAFNTGPHNCAGAPLARLELKVFLEEWLKRMPDIALAPGFKPETRGGSVMQMTRLDIVW